jgi:Secretory lipase
MRFSVVVLILSSACGRGDLPFEEVDAGEVDVGVQVDGGAQLDGGAEVDAGGPDDAGDAGSPVDAGLTPDAGAVVDAGLPTVVCERSSGSTSAPLDVSGLVDGQIGRCEVATLPDGGPVIAGRDTYRVVYRTTTVLVADGGVTVVPLAASGLVVIPARPATEERPVLANTHGTTGLLPSCGPSRALHFDSRVVFDELATAAPDAVVVVPDFVGLGVDSALRSPDAAHTVTAPFFPFNRLTPMANVSHPYVSIEGEGRATIDLVRATRQFPSAGVGSSPKWLVLGVSQGGHAALATGEVWSHGYGADTRLRGVLAGAPGALFENTAFVENDLERVLTPMVVVGLSLEAREVSPARLFTSQALAGFGSTAGRQCVSPNAIVEWVTTMNLSLTGAPLFRIDPLSDAPTRAALHRNSPGFEATTVPVFIGQTTGDPFIDPRRTALLVELERTTNAGRVTACVYPGTNLGQPWLLRAQNHDTFSFMFSGPAACTDPAGRPTAATARSFVASQLAAP